MLSIEKRETTTIEITRENLYKIKEVALSLKCKVREALDEILKEYFIIKGSEK